MRTAVLGRMGEVIPAFPKAATLGGGPTIQTGRIPPGTIMTESFLASLFFFFFFFFFYCSSYRPRPLGFCKVAVCLLKTAHGDSTVCASPVKR